VSSSELAGQFLRRVKPAAWTGFVNVFAEFLPGDVPFFGQSGEENAEG
jgi:hypothetical protein